MGRLSTINDAVVFNAVGTQIAAFGTLKLQDVVSSTGVSIGSLYHRYGSREGLLAQAWLDAVLSFQARFLAELESGGRKAGERAAMATPRFCREEPERARLLICCRREELFSERTPEEMKAELEAANKYTFACLDQFAKNNNYAADACQLGLIAYPLAAVRQYLPDREVPKRVDDYVVAAFRSAIRLK